MSPDDYHDLLDAAREANDGPVNDRLHPACETCRAPLCIAKDCYCTDAREPAYVADGHAWCHLCAAPCEACSLVRPVDEATGRCADCDGAVAAPDSDECWAAEGRAVP